MILSRPVLIEGETGSGKTAVSIEYIKKVTGKDPLIISCNPDTSKEDLEYSKELVIVTQDDKGNPIPATVTTKTLTQGFQKAAKEGRGLILDEFNYLSDDLKGIINNRLDALTKKGTTQEIKGNGGGTMTIDPKYFVIATANL